MHDLSPYHPERFLLTIITYLNNWPKIDISKKEISWWNCDEKGIGRLTANALHKVLERILMVKLFEIVYLIY